MSLSLSVITLYKNNTRVWIDWGAAFFPGFSFTDSWKYCTIFLVYYYWLKTVWFLYHGGVALFLSAVSDAGLDMSLMLLWACMLSSHFSPQNFSTVTLHTVPGSRQCGATPGEETIATKDSSLVCILTTQFIVPSIFQWQLGFTSSAVPSNSFPVWFVIFLL